MKVIVVGGVAGEASCAARLRGLDEKAEILMVERGPYVSYANCGLPDHVGGDHPIKPALDAELAKRWLKNTDSEQADKYIGYQPGIGQELRCPVRLRNVHDDGMVSGLEEWKS